MFFVHFNLHILRKNESKIIKKMVGNRYQRKTYFDLFTSYSTKILCNIN